MPKVGTVEKEQISAQVWAETNRLLTDFTALAPQVRDSVWTRAERLLTDFTALAPQVRDSVWAAAARTLTGFAAKDLFDLPLLDSVYPHTSFNASATANTFGAWVQVLANVGTGKRLIGVAVISNANAADVDFEVELGEGAAGSEVTKARIAATQWAVTDVGYRPLQIYYLWRALSDNARLSVRVRTDQAVAYEFLVNVLIA